jgi:hypothetical protein
MKALLLAVWIILDAALCAGFGGSKAEKSPGPKGLILNGYFWLGR